MGVHLWTDFRFRLRVLTSPARLSIKIATATHTTTQPPLCNLEKMRRIGSGKGEEKNDDNVCVGDSELSVRAAVRAWEA